MLEVCARAYVLRVNEKRKKMLNSVCLVAMVVDDMGSTISRIHVLLYSMHFQLHNYVSKFSCFEISIILYGLKYNKYKNRDFGFR